jgi:vacuolar-type H+-ATPase subunit D/Vma8
VALTRIDEKIEKVLIVINLIEKNTIPTGKISKHQKEVKLSLNENIINELKKNLRQNFSNGTIIRYSPTDVSEINRIGR